MASIEDYDEDIVRKRFVFLIWIDAVISMSSNFAQFRTHSLDTGLDTDITDPVVLASPVTSRPRLNINKGTQILVDEVPDLVLPYIMCVQ